MATNVIIKENLQNIQQTIRLSDIPYGTIFIGTIIDEGVEYPGIYARLRVTCDGGPDTYNRTIAVSLIPFNNPLLNNQSFKMFYRTYDLVKDYKPIDKLALVVESYK